MKTFYDEFKAMPLDKMSQQITDITFLYKETEVPKNHYKKYLNKAIEEILADSVEINLIDHYVKTLENLKKENEKLFRKAMLSMELGIKISKITPKEHHALDHVYLTCEQEKVAYLNPQIDEIYTSI